MPIVGPGIVGWRFGLCPVLSTTRDLAFYLSVEINLAV
ncbi:hypothetical protein FMEAI12_3850012 [Parafrankia sp. Ea1.12]|nr:hypothetical protein FMEAI12_3850012 [Parafrankia sp. Ea1.12]